MNRNLFVATALFALSAQFLTAQTQAINGTIRGRVTDPGGAPISKATVEAVSPDLGFSRTFDTPDDGYFVFPNLPLGMV